MSDLATLQAKGFFVRRNDDGTVSIHWPNADPKTTCTVKLDDGDKLHLVPSRSATHKMLAQELGR